MKRGDVARTHDQKRSWQTFCQRDHCSTVHRSIPLITPNKHLAQLPPLVPDARNREACQKELTLPQHRASFKKGKDFILIEQDSVLFGPKEGRYVRVQSRLMVTFASKANFSSR
jgi:hypothetical protein